MGGEKTGRKQVGKSIFNYPNGDVYLGSYRISPPNSLTISGQGMYLCNDRTVLVGDWVKNELIYGRIKFPNCVEYIGNFVKLNFQGEGIYKNPGVGSIIGNWKECVPTGELTLVDNDRLVWRGMVENNSVQFYPVNQFLESPFSTRDVNFVPKKQDNEDDEINTLEKSNITKS